jgi:hypothetical protein
MNRKKQLQKIAASLNVNSITKQVQVHFLQIHLASIVPTVIVSLLPLERYIFYVLPWQKFAIKYRYTTSMFLTKGSYDLSTATAKLC